jgi:hypothetical protein
LEELKEFLYIVKSHTGELPKTSPEVINNVVIREFLIGGKRVGVCMHGQMGMANMAALVSRTLAGNINILLYE